MHHAEVLLIQLEKIKKLKNLEGRIELNKRRETKNICKSYLQKYTNCLFLNANTFLDIKLILISPRFKQNRETETDQKETDESIDGFAIPDRMFSKAK